MTLAKTGHANESVLSVQQDPVPLCAVFGANLRSLPSWTYKYHVSRV